MVRCEAMKNPHVYNCSCTLWLTRLHGCKTVIGSRCKQSGMFWGQPGAENVLALRCIQSSRRLGEFWRERLNTHAARNDSLALAA
jgi:hypothetical protein